MQDQTVFWMEQGMLDLMEPIRSMQLVYVDACGKQDELLTWINLGLLFGMTGTALFGNTTGNPAKVPKLDIT